MGKNSQVSTRCLHKTKAILFSQYRKGKQLKERWQKTKGADDIISNKGLSGRKKKTETKKGASMVLAGYTRTYGNLKA